MIVAPAAGKLGPAQRHTLLEVARHSIAHGLNHGQPLSLEPSEYHRDLQAIRASFVTLTLYNELRGCIGHLEAMQPLVVDVAENAFAAAFLDSRFAPIDTNEWRSVKLHIAVLSQPVPLEFENEHELLAQLRPGKDGLILTDGPHRGTFLPTVWESLPEPRDFLAHLKRKAGLAANHWSEHLTIARYDTEQFGDD